MQPPTSKRTSVCSPDVTAVEPRAHLYGPSTFAYGRRGASSSLSRFPNLVSREVMCPQVRVFSADSKQ
eukprot:3076745-Prymnesium_polylepis.2